MSSSISATLGTWGVARYTGSTRSVADLADEYGFTDIEDDETAMTLGGVSPGWEPTW